MLTPSPCHTLSHIPGPPKLRHTSRTPRLLVGLVQKHGQKPSVQILSQLFAGVFCLEGFVRDGFCPFPLQSEYICYKRKLNITLNFMFHMYDKKIYKRVTSHALDPLPLSQTATPSRTPSPLERYVLYGRPQRKPNQTKLSEQN